MRSLLLRPPQSQRVAYDHQAQCLVGADGSALRAPAEPCTAVIGNFDGVHRGHQHVIAYARKHTRGELPLIAVTFDPHPKIFFQRQDSGFLLSRPEQKQDWLMAAGADAVVTIAFDHALAALDADAFCQRVLGALNVSHVGVGTNFRFGHNRQGSIATLQQHGFEVIPVPVYRDSRDEEPITSSAIRALLAQGKLAKANPLLGRRFTVEGTIIPGEKRGRTLGFPTANVQIHDYTPLRFGVYAVVVALLDTGHLYKGVASYGVRPTFAKGQHQPLLEVHICHAEHIGPDALYGQKMTVSFIAFLRPEIPFDSPRALIAQMRKDQNQANNTHPNLGFAPEHLSKIKTAPTSAM